MRIKSIYCKNYRNFPELKLNFHPELNYIVGPNAAGKSNILDAVWILATLSSSRPYVDNNFSSWDLAEIDFAKLECEVTTGSNSDKLEIIYSILGGRNKRAVKLNETNTTPAKFRAKIFPILFTPLTLDMIAGEPENRRWEIDAFISLLDIEYVHKLNLYKNVLRSRNRLLGLVADGRAAEKELDYWTDQLVHLSAYIYKQRLWLFDTLQNIYKDTASSFILNKKKTLRVVYVSRLDEILKGDNLQEGLKMHYTENLGKEIAAKRTLYGPHRDDFDIFAEDKSVKIYGSRGEQRLYALAFKFALLPIAHEHKGVNPILLLDDIFSELDKSNSENLMEYLYKLPNQKIISVTDKEVIKKTAKEDVEVIYLEA